MLMQLFVIHTERPEWVDRMHRGVKHPTTPMFFTNLLKELGVAGNDPIISYCACLRRMFAMVPRNMAYLFELIADKIGGREALFHAVTRIDALLDHTSLAGAVERAEYNWDRDLSRGDCDAARGERCHLSFEQCRAFLAERHGHGWRMLDEATAHLAVLIEAVRQEDGGVVLDPRVARCEEPRPLVRGQ